MIYKTNKMLIIKGTDIRNIYHGSDVMFQY
jgi:hypothetical protein